MKKKFRIRTGRLNGLAKVCYYTQLVVLSPILIPVVILYALCEGILKTFGLYKDWYLRKTVKF